MNFQSLGLSDTLLRAVEATGYTTPTPIQARAIPAILEGRDVMAAAQTGTGKTAGFTLPLLQLLNGKSRAAAKRCRALVLTPTRELAAQVQDSIETYGKHEPLNSAVVFGGVNINPQIKALHRGVDVLVATPGRLMDLYNQRAVSFEDLEILVLDEADRMLDMGFIRDIKKILALLPKRRQNLMFSATFSPEIRSLAKGLCSDPVEIDVAPRNSTVEAITQRLYSVPKQDKVDLLSRILREKSDQALVFSRTKHGADKLVRKLAKDDISAAAIHGNKSQNQRTRALDAFKDNRVQVLVATDIAARGIDIDQLARVINFDLPQVAEDYVHRIGRTGRAGASGEAISLVCEDEDKQLRAIERLIKRKIERASADSIDVPARPAAAQPRAAAEPASEGREEPRRNQARRQGAAGGQEGQPRRRRRRSGNRAGKAASGQQRSAEQGGKSGGSGRRGAQPRRERAPEAGGKSRAQQPAVANNDHGFWQSLRNSLTGRA